MLDAADQMSTSVGTAKRDITPESPVRLSGYAARKTPFTAVRDPIFVRTMAIGDDEQLCVMVSIESLSVSAEQTKRIAAEVQRRHGIDRARLVVCSTHSHATPHPAGSFENLFRDPMTPRETEALEQWTQRVHEQTIACIDAAIGNRRPAKLTIGDGKADFAVNRRVLDRGTWTGFGITADGPVDRRVRVFMARDADEKLIGVAFQYACHCTTVGPGFNELTGDWAGVAAAALEARHESAIFLPIIGCGADANPEPRVDYEDILAHGRAMTEAVATVLDRTADSGAITRLSAAPTARFGFAGISSELPTKESLKERLENDNVTERRWAEKMLAIWDQKGRLPESYPAPIHTWSFGDDLLWVFLGGEVVVDYQIRIESEQDAFSQVWVAAYADDCFAYVASERMREEGGYEVDFSMFYYSQPGRWQSGTEDLLVRRVDEILRSEQPEEAKSPEDSLGRIEVPEGFRVQLVAAEPLVQDPINIAFDADGSVWVVEMGDYPLGNETGGRVKHLSDDDGDGVMDRSEVFLDRLDYPTSVMPWRDGVLVLAASELIWAQDVDGDGKADETEVLLSGFAESNPQHRASGFDFGLDGYVYFGAGQGTREITSTRAGVTVDVSHGDVRFDPDTGDVEKITGATQFVRSRDRFGRWYGNTNSVPLYHYRIDDVGVAARNRDVPVTRLMLDPGVAPPVYPRSRVVDRFNDLFAKQRFTSACSSIVLRGDGMGPAMVDAALVCEPVHNLVARFAVSGDGDSLQARRFDTDVQARRDWLVSRDTWFRPVRVAEAPDGSVWIVDMYRRVIEHPQWIPDSWQSQMDLRAGHDKGRLYRIVRDDDRDGDASAVSSSSAGPPVDLTAMDDAALGRALVSSHGTRRDLAMQQFLWRGDPGSRRLITDRMSTAKDPATRLQAFATLVAAGWATPDDYEFMLSQPDERVRACVVRWAGRRMTGGNLSNPSFTFSAGDFIDLVKIDSPIVAAESLIAIGNADLTDDEIVKLGATIRLILREHFDQPSVIEAVSLMKGPQAALALRCVLDGVDRQVDLSGNPEAWNLLESCVTALWKSCSAESRLNVLEQRIKSGETDGGSSQLLLAMAASRTEPDDEAIAGAFSRVIHAARSDLRSTDQPIEVRIRAAKLLGSPLIAAPDQLSDLRFLLDVNQPGAIRLAALSAAYRIADDRTADVLIEAWPHLLPEERRTAEATLMQRDAWTRKLVECLLDGSIHLTDLDSATRHQLMNYQNYWVMKQVGTLMTRPSPSDRRGLIDDHLSQIGSFDKIDDEAIRRGHALYEKNCAVCHESVDAARPAIGPALQNLKHWTPEQWVTAILDPAANIESKYRQYRLLTDDGQIFAGVVIDQSDEAVRVGLSDGKRVEVLRKELESIEASEISMMPEGLHETLSAGQIGEIICFLRSR